LGCYILHQAKHSKIAKKTSRIAVNLYSSKRERIFKSIHTDFMLKKPTIHDLYEKLEFIVC